MKIKDLNRLASECGNLYNTLPDQALTTWNFFVEVNQIAAKYTGCDCLLHIVFANGNITQGLCLITDWQPGALVLQSDEGELPKLRIIHPDEFADFMAKTTPIFDVEYPLFPAEQGAE